MLSFKSVTKGELIKIDTKIETQLHHDAYFLRKADAALVAAQCNRVKLNHPTITGLQICYFDGPPAPDDLPNLIGVPLEISYEYFSTTRNRLPQTFVGFSGVPPEMAELFASIVKAAANDRLRLAALYNARIQALAKPFPLSGPFKIFLTTSRLTTVMQYCSKNLAKAFESLGHNVRLSTEQNEMEQLDQSIHFKSLFEFEPEIVVQINKSSLLEEGLPESIFNVVWWQDRMPELLEGKRFKSRDRDITFSALQQLDPLLENFGISEIQRQGFCVDTEVFFDEDNATRKNKIVFVGHSYIDHVDENNVSALLALQDIKDEFERGSCLTPELLNKIATSRNLPYQYVFWNLLHYVVRDISVEWLCEISPIPVEVYGRHWERNASVRPFFKGELEHGKELARVYQTARYALVVHPFELNSQRLAEVAAAGAIPLVYDCRHTSCQPHWDSELCFYKTKKEISNILRAQEGQAAPNIGHYYSYRKFAERIIQCISSKL